MHHVVRISLGTPVGGKNSYDNKNQWTLDVAGIDKHCTIWTMVILKSVSYQLKGDRLHPRDYPHTPTDYRHTDKQLRLVMSGDG